MHPNQGAASGDVAEDEGVVHRGIVVDFEEEVAKPAPVVGNSRLTDYFGLGAATWACRIGDRVHHARMCRRGHARQVMTERAGRAPTTMEGVVEACCGVVPIYRYGQQLTARAN